MRATFEYLFFWCFIRCVWCWMAMNCNSTSQKKDTNNPANLTLLLPSTADTENWKKKSDYQCACTVLARRGCLEGEESSKPEPPCRLQGDVFSRPQFAHANAITRIFSLGDGTLVTGSRDSTLRFWTNTPSIADNLIDDRDRSQADLAVSTILTGPNEWIHDALCFDAGHTHERVMIMASDAEGVISLWRVRKDQQEEPASISVGRNHAASQAGGSWRVSQIHQDRWRRVPAVSFLRNEDNHVAYTAPMSKNSLRQPMPAVLPPFVQCGVHGDASAGLAEWVRYQTAAIGRNNTLRLVEMVPDGMRITQAQDVHPPERGASLWSIGSSWKCANGGPSYIAFGTTRGNLGLFDPRNWRSNIWWLASAHDTVVRGVEWFGPAELLTYSSDCTIKHWDVRKPVQPVATYNCSSSPWSLVTHEKKIYAGLLTGEILSMDMPLTDKTATREFEMPPACCSTANGDYWRRHHHYCPLGITAMHVDPSGRTLYAASADSTLVALPLRGESAQTAVYWGHPRLCSVEIIGDQQRCIVRDIHSHLWEISLMDGRVMKDWGPESDNVTLGSVKQEVERPIVTPRWTIVDVTLGYLRQSMRCVSSGSSENLVSSSMELLAACTSSGQQPGMFDANVCMGRILLPLLPRVLPFDVDEEEAAECRDMVNIGWELFKQLFAPIWSPKGEKPRIRGVAFLRESLLTLQRDSHRAAFSMPVHAIHQILGSERFWSLVLPRTLQDALRGGTPPRSRDGQGGRYVVVLLPHEESGLPYLDNDDGRSISVDLGMTLTDLIELVRVNTPAEAMLVDQPESSKCPRSLRPSQRQHKPEQATAQSQLGASLANSTDSANLTEQPMCVPKAELCFYCKADVVPQDADAAYVLTQLWRDRPPVFLRYHFADPDLRQLAAQRVARIKTEDEKGPSNSERSLLGRLWNRLSALR